MDGDSKEIRRRDLLKELREVGHQIAVLEARETALKKELRKIAAELSEVSGE